MRCAYIHRPGCCCVWIATCLLVLATSPGTLAAQEPAPGSDWENWFFGQRMYGLGYIPQDGLADAVDQRDNAQSSQFFSTSTTRSGLSTAAPGSRITEGSWFPLGPGGMNSSLVDMVSGRVASLAIDPLNPSTVYIAAAGGGVWKSTNRGGLWTPLTDRLPSLASGAVAVDPFTGEVWYGTGELNFCRDCYYGAGVYRSGDGGANWTRVNPEGFLSSPTWVIVFDHQNEGTLFVGRSSALWKSSDGGETWRVVLRGVMTDLALNPVDSSIAYAAVGNATGSSENGVYRSADGGETRTRLNTGLPEQPTIGRVALAVAPSSSDIVFALIARSSDFKLNGLFRSLNGGVSFGRLGNLPEDLFTEDGVGQGLFNLLVQVDPVNPAVVYAGGVELWKSTDFGSNWENLSALKNLHEDPRAIIFEPSDPRTFYLTGDSGVWRSSDGGATFGHLNQTLAITQFQSVGLHPSNPGLAVGGTQDNGTALYTGSSIWEQGRPGDSGAAFYDRANPETLYTVARRHSLRRSDDGGASFQLIAEGLDITDRVLFYPPFLADPSQSSTLYFATHRLWRSQNRGDQWQSVSGDLTGGGSATISSVAVAPSDPAVIYAGTSDARVQVSHDQGQTWTLAAEFPNRFVTSIAIDPLLPQRVIAAVSGFGTGHVFLSENFGAGWEDISGNLPDIPVNTVLMDASSPETVYAGTDIGVFVRLPDGAWSPLLDGMPNAIVLGLSQNPATGLLVAATHGRGTFAIATGGPAGNFPRMDALTNGASFELAPVVPGMVAALFGENLASVTQNVEGPLPLPFSLGGTTVWVDDVPAPLFFVSPGQINF